MIRCRIAGFLFKAFAWKRWQDILIRRHMEACPHCRAGLASREEALTFLVREADMESVDSLWTGIRRKLRQAERGDGKRGVVREWLREYAAGAAGLIAAAVMAVLLIHGFKSENITPAGPTESGILVHSLLVEGMPARFVIFQPQDSKMIIIWAENARKGGVSP